jgi:peptide/nickel transport system substrate-binding protein
MPTNPWLRLSVSPVALALGLGLIAPAPAASQTTFKAIPHSDVRVLDPYVNNSGITTEFAYMIWDNLFGVDKDDRPQPQAADSYSVSPDGLVYTITLRAGMKFSDGQPVRAADAVASIKRWALRDISGKKMLDLGMALAVKDDRTFTLTLKEPWGLVIDSLSKTVSVASFIQREKDAALDGNTAVTEFVGSGPFKFMKEQWVPGSKVVFEKNADYRPRAESANFYAGGKAAKVDRVEWVIVPDSNTANAALIAGEVDFYGAVPNDLVPVLKRNRDVTVAVHNKSGYLAYLRPNFLHPPFNNEKARQALLYLVNQEDYMRSAIGGDESSWKTCYAWLVCGTATASEAGTDAFRKPNMDRAKQLFKEAGYNNEPIVVMRPADFKIINALTEVTIQRMREAGLNVVDRTMDWGQLIQQRGKKEPPGQGGWSMYHTYSTGLELGPPIANFNISGACEEKSWFGWPCDPETERLRDAWAKEQDTAKRKAIAEQLQVRATQFVHYVPLGQFFTPVAYRNNVKGIMEVPWQVYWNVEKAR